MIIATAISLSSGPPSPSHADGRPKLPTYERNAALRNPLTRPITTVTEAAVWNPFQPSYAPKSSAITPMQNPKCKPFFFSGLNTALRRAQTFGALWFTCGRRGTLRNFCQILQAGVAVTLFLEYAWQRSRSQERACRR